MGTFLRSFRWGHARQLDRVSRELLARAWAAGAGPGDAPQTIDLDSTICETYGLAKEGARHHGYTGARGYHPLLAIAAGTGDVAQLPVGARPPAGPGEPRVAVPGLGGWCGTRPRAVDHRPGLHHLRDLWAGQGGGASSRLHRRPGLSPAAGHCRRRRRRADGPAQEGRANTARGAAHFLRETVGRVRYAGARGQLTVRADRGFYPHSVAAACRKLDVHFSITIRQRARLRNLIGAIPEDAWTPIPYWMDGPDGRRRRCGRNHLHPLPE